MRQCMDAPKAAMAFSFTKWQGCGNDFVLVNCFEEELAGRDLPALARTVCDRHYGIGADGLILVLPSDTADFRMQILNADGSEAEMCGNGIRCFAGVVHTENLTRKEEFTVETGAGILVPRLIFQNGTLDGVRVDMGEPILEGERIPVTGFGRAPVIEQPIEAVGAQFSMTCVSMGNPHCVIFVDDAEAVPIFELGPVLEHHACFPRKTNVEFAEIKDSAHIRMRVWERGAAVTLACGTGSCATLVAAALTNRTGRKAEVELDGGKLQIEWAADNHLYMTGPAQKVFSGLYA